MLAAALTFLATSTSAYRVVDTGIVASTCTAMNDRGEIVGYRGAELADGYGFYWKDGKLTVIKSPDDGPVLFTDINNDGVAVGMMYEYDSASDIPAIYRRDKGLKAFPDKSFEPWTISETGLIAGGRYDDELRESVLGYWTLGKGFTAVAVSEDGMPMFGFSDINDGGAMGVNTLSRYAFRTGWELNNFAFQFAKNQAPLLLATDAPDLSKPVHFRTAVAAINNQGWMCGSIDVPDVTPPNQPPPRLVSSRSYTPLPGMTIREWTYEGGPLSFPAGAAAIWLPNNSRIQLGPGTSFRDINDSCVAVGTQRTIGIGPQARNAIVWDRTSGVRSLNSLVPEGSPALDAAVSINRQGEILCAGHTDEEQGRWYVLKPGS